MTFGVNRSARSLRLIGAALAISVAVVVALLLWNAASTTSAPTLVATNSALGPPDGNGGAVSLDFAFLDAPRPLPTVRFIDGTGRNRSLADLRGHPLILNIWATWCVPCRKEMPTLDRLQATLKGSDALVVPLSIDSKGLPAVEAFYREIGITSLGTYVNQSGDATHLLEVVGIPTTLLVDRNGREIGRKIGPADWDSPDMVALIRSRLNPQAAGAKDAHRQ
ncbi:MAG: TlpA family protein disulfide reductase [Alphaproteobacteria bacterium]|nr:TlpA family protein disulfide reductase [Alphaproteobacteria bacterium]